MIKRIININGVEISTLSIMCLFMPLIISDEATQPEELENTVTTCLTEIESLIKREMNVDEMEKLFDGIKYHFTTKEATDERKNSMKYLFELKFLTP